MHFPSDPNRFVFDQSVADIFDDMAVRSLPGYEYVYDLITSYVMRHGLPAYSQVWDFGTSTGTGLKAVQRGAPHPYVQYYGCDVSLSMLHEASVKSNWFDLIEHDLTRGLPEELQPGNVSVAMFGWTLQFLQDQDIRRNLLRDTFSALAPGGILFVMEKFKDTGPMGLIQQDAYIGWRRSNGYSLPEIKAKTEALKGSMFPWETSDLLMTMQDLPGLSAAIQLYRMFTFGGYAFIKET